MTLLTDAVRAALTAGRLAHLVTLNPDGSPQITLVWVGVDGDEIVTAHLGLYKKLRNLQRDPRVALSIEAAGSESGGLEHYLVVHGHAKVTEGGAPELLEKLTKIYLGPDAPPSPIPNPPPGYVLRITPERVGGIGPWKP
ncbi:putative F420-dependent enzyme [Candidatus Protofrankia datiscae]|uniref:Putative F420-dependent enzyme n=1 Tax=Candidatus Protofrankia datiscae TaxID=2716812 RepID=F8AXD4_9ACTN|nr:MULTISPECIES: PPOX class F420-dependent oxidoreductase [Protofrankia]AEH09414.1 putative F420-dependent enzyme [Candidatus Protofrankia datiscae]